MDVEAHLQTLGRMLRGVDEQDTRALVRALLGAPVIYLAGQGRLGHVVRCFATRLTELGLRCHVLGDATTPACQRGSLVLLVSGSGRTPALLTAAEHACVAEARVVLVTSAPLSPLSRLAHTRIFLPPALPESSRSDAPGIPPDEASLVASLRPLFEQAAFLYLDALVPLLMDATGQRLTDLESRRPNLD